MCVFSLVVRVAAVAHEALGPDLHQIQKEINLLKSELFTQLDIKIRKGVEAAFNLTLDSLLLSLLSLLASPGISPSLSASSCKEILQPAPQSPSGLYWIRGTHNGPKHMYCDMERNCKSVGGGWMRVYSFNITDNIGTCPIGLNTITSPRKLCGKSSSRCVSVMFPVQGVEYSQVCGKIIGFQDGTPDAFFRFSAYQTTVDTNYIDGISLTHGQSPRQHIWTFVAALHEAENHPLSVCPCSNIHSTHIHNVPSFLGHDYFCDTGSRGNTQFRTFYGDDPLWDGAGCSENSTCCEWNSPPWFRKEISPSSHDDIEMRLCTDEGQGNEKIFIESLDIYVQ